MRILLDEQLPRRLIRQLAPHQVRTVQQQGWAGLRNGELLRRAAAQGFEIFLTGDQNFQFQQNLTGSSICALISIARSIKIEDLLADLKIKDDNEAINPDENDDWEDDDGEEETKQ